jgi:hypothetical protein
MKLLLSLGALALLTFAFRPAAPQDKPLDLSGKWKTDRGEEVVIVHHGGSVTANFVSGGDCEWGGSRSYYLQGELKANTLTGHMQGCTQIQALHDDCHLTDPYDVEFTATVDASHIKGTYRPDYITYDEQNGHYANCRISPGAGSVTSFTLTRVCDPCQALAGALATVSAAEQAVGSAALYQSLQQTMGAELDQIAGQLCNDSSTQSELDKVRQALAALNFVAGQSNIPNNERLLDIEDGLSQLSASLCAAAPTSGSGVCAAGEKPVEPGDDEAAKFVKDKFKEALDKVKETAREMEDRGASVPQQIKDQIKNLQKALDFWSQVKAGSCVPPDVIQTMRQVANDHRASGHSENCPPMCAALTKWYEALIGANDSIQGKAFMDYCLATCD